jgi:hypothetical protein
MSEPRVFDVRDGLTPEVLEDLRRARRVSLAVKDARTAALGYWVEATDPPAKPVQEIRIALLRCEGVGGQPGRAPQAVVSPPQGPVLRMVRRPLAPFSGVLLDLADTQADAFWGRVLGLLRAGDVVVVGRDWSWGALPALRIGNGKMTLAWLRLPSRRLEARKRPAA